MTGNDFGDEFILLPLNGNHTESIFEDVEYGIYDNENIKTNTGTNINNNIKTISKTINLCDCPPSNFIERGRIMQEVFKYFVDCQKCVTIQGLRGKIFLIYHIIQYHTISYHTIQYHIISYHTISYHIIQYHIISYHSVQSYHTILYHIISYRIILCRIRSYHIMPYYVALHYIIVDSSAWFKRVLHMPIDCFVNLFIYYLAV